MGIIKPRTATVVIYQGDDLVRLSELDDAATKAELAQKQAERAKNIPGRVRLLNEPDDVAAAVIAATEEYEAAKAARDEFASEAEARGVAVALKSLPRKDWRRLRNAHPPRDGNSEDEMFDCNVDALPDEAFPMSIDRAESTIEGDLDEFLDSLTDYDYYRRLFPTMLALNVGGAAADPKARLGSLDNSTSSAT